MTAKIPVSLASLPSKHSSGGFVKDISSGCHGASRFPGETWRGADNAFVDFCFSRDEGMEYVSNDKEALQRSRDDRGTTDCIVSECAS